MVPNNRILKAQVQWTLGQAPGPAPGPKNAQSKTALNYVVNLSHCAD